MFGLAALAIPIIIHLFDFRRTKKVYFSNTELLHQVKESTQSFYNLKHLLILLSRIFFIAFLVMTFAQPFINSSGDVGLTSNKVGIYIDNTQSMSNKLDQDESGLEMTKSLALEMIDLYPAGTEFIIQSSFDVKSAFMYTSKQEAKNRVKEIGFSSEFHSLQTILGNFQNSRDNLPPREIVLISDFQKSTLGTEKINGDSLTHIIALPVTFETYDNLTIDTVFASNPFELNKSKRNLVVRVKNFSSDEVSNILVKILANDRQLSVTSISVSAYEHVDIEFNIGQDLEVKQQGEIVIEDYPVSFDNKLYFSIEETEKIDILQIMGEHPSQFVSAVFGNENLFSELKMPATNIDYNLFSESDLIILNQIDKLDVNLALRLIEFQSNGGSVLVVPAETQSLSSYQVLIPSLEQTNIDEMEIELQPPDFTRPFFKDILEKSQTNISMPATKAVWKWGGDRNALLKFIDGRPFLSEISPNLFIMASPLSDSYSEFQTNALFVPVMYRLAANSKQNILPLFYRLSEQELELSVNEIAANDIFKLSRDGKEFIPDQRIRGRNIIMVLPGASMTAGHYDVIKDDVPVHSIALNLDTDESDLIPASTNDLNAALESYDHNVIYGSNKDEIITKISNEYQGIELWRYFLAIALLFLFVEALLIRLL